MQLRSLISFSIESLFQAAWDVAFIDFGNFVDNILSNPLVIRSLKCCEMCKMAFCVQAHYDKHVELNHPDGKLRIISITRVLFLIF